MAYTKKIPVDLDCPLRLCLPEAASRVLDIQLRELLNDGLFDKTIYPELPPRSEYKISGLGKTLIAIIDALHKCGEEHFDIFEKKYGSENISAANRGNN